MKKKLLTLILPVTLGMVLFTALFSMQACTMKQRMLLTLDRVKVNHFYTTSYSGEVKQKYEKMIQECKKYKGKYPFKACKHSIHPENAPPIVNRFRRGERVCLAVHSDLAQLYTITDDYAGTKTKHWVTASDYSKVVGTRFEFGRLSIGAYSKAQRWEVVCIRRFYDYKDEYKPDKWVWLDSLEPGLYNVKFKGKEFHTDRTYTLETSFTVE